MVEKKETIAKERDYAICVFYDNAFNIYVQERGEYSKMGEKYTFWGGMIEDGEIPKDAVLRELEEELDHIPDKINYWGDYSFEIQEKGKFHGYKLNVSVFISPVEPGFENTKTNEGVFVTVLPIQEVIKEEGFLKGIASFMPYLQKHLRKELEE